MSRQLHARGRDVDTVFHLAIFTPISPQLVEHRFGSGWGVGFDPTHTYGMDKLGDLFLLPFGWDETTFWFRCQRQW